MLAQVEARGRILIRILGFAFVRYSIDIEATETNYGVSFPVGAERTLEKLHSSVKSD